MGWGAYSERVVDTTLHDELVDRLRQRSLRTDGPFTLRSGASSDWYLDARLTTLDGAGALVVGRAMLSELSGDVTAIGGLTMGADPIASATAIAGAMEGRPLVAFSIRKAPKDHGTGGRLVGPVDATDRVAVIDDTVTTGGALVEAIEVVRAEGIQVVEAVTLVDRSQGAVQARMDLLGIPYRALVVPSDLGVDA